MYYLTFFTYRYCYRHTRKKKKIRYWINTNITHTCHVRVYSIIFFYFISILWSTIRSCLPSRMISSLCFSRSQTTFPSNNIAILSAAFEWLCNKHSFYPEHLPQEMCYFPRTFQLHHIACPRITSLTSQSLSFCLVSSDFIFLLLSFQWLWRMIWGIKSIKTPTYKTQNIMLV